MQPVIAVDVGGTFTDCVGWTPEGIRVAKLLTTADQSQAVVEGVACLAPTGSAALLHGSTVATNALLERKGADTVLVTDPGFEDVLEIGRQDRPSLYDSLVDRPEPLVGRDDRLGSTDPDVVAAWVSRRRPESVAVSLAYSFTDPTQERRLAERLAGAGITTSVSHRVAAEFREFERCSTTVLNAYLTPVVSGYLDTLAIRAREMTKRVQVMRSSGGLMEVAEAAELAAALLLSGPAGGVVAAAELGRARDLSRVITFDMGGTSTDVCRIEGGRPEIGYEREIDGYVCRMPSVAVHTVGAGGGSVAWVDSGGSLRVGPRSAGADPGPAAYRRGGTEATVTDAHLVLGHLDPTRPMGGQLTLHSEAADSAVEALAFRIGLEADQTARGVVEVVEAHMERAIRRVSVAQGADPRPATLVAFGGAGGLHATALARRLGMESVVIPPYAGVFSALGLLMAPPRVDAARSVVGSVSFQGLAVPVGEVVEIAEQRYRRLHGDDPETVSVIIDLRYLGQAHEIAVPFQVGEREPELTGRFHRLHHEHNGFSRPDDPVEVVTVRAVAEGSALIGWRDLPTLTAGPEPTPGRRQLLSPRGEVEAEVWWRPDLPAGFSFRGPAIVEEEAGTSLFGPDDRITVAADGTLEAQVG